MENETEKQDSKDSADPAFNEEMTGWSFHKWPFLIAVGITLLLYILVFAFVDPNPPYFDPSELPPPPAGG